VAARMGHGGSSHTDSAVRRLGMVSVPAAGGSRTAPRLRAAGRGAAVARVAFLDEPRPARPGARRGGAVVAAGARLDHVCPAPRVAVVRGRRRRPGARALLAGTGAL